MLRCSCPVRIIVCEVKSKGCVLSEKGLTITGCKGIVVDAHKKLICITDTRVFRGQN
jgi:hypothetical protein